jgi:hypothetical protein
MSQRRNSTAARLSDRLYRASTTIPSIQDHLGEQRALVGIISAATTDGSHGSKGDHSDPTARALVDLVKIEGKGQAITDALASINIGINLLDEACRDALGYQARREPADDEEAKPRCIGDNTAAGAACWQIPAERRDHRTNQTIDDGRCLDCGTRYDERKARKAESERKRRLGGDAA